MLLLDGELLFFEKRFLIEKDSPNEKKEEVKKKRMKEQDDVLAFVMGEVEHLEEEDKQAEDLTEKVTIAELIKARGSKERVS